jgi:hypothetical protein
VPEPLITDMNPRQLPPGALLGSHEAAPPLQMHVQAASEHVTYLVANGIKLKVEQPPENRPPHPASPLEVCERLMEKMCETCLGVYRKQFEYLKQQSHETLLSLNFLTAVRHLQLSDFLQKRDEAGGPITNQQLLSYSARSRYLFVD